MQLSSIIFYTALRTSACLHHNGKKHTEQAEKPPPPRWQEAHGSNLDVNGAGAASTDEVVQPEVVPAAAATRASWRGPPPPGGTDSPLAVEPRRIGQGLQWQQAAWSTEEVGHLAQISRVQAHGKYLHVITGRFKCATCTASEQEVAARVNEVSDASLADVKLEFGNVTFPSWILDDPAWSRHLRFLQDPGDASQRGGGYWFWKSAITSHVLESHHIAEDDPVLFVDSDISTTYLKEDVENAMEVMKQWDMVALLQPYVENMWSKGDFFDKIGLEYTSHAANTGQFLAGKWMVRNSASGRRFMRCWRTCVANWHLVSDEPSTVPNYIYFRENRHDQSCFSLLLKGVSGFHNEGYVPSLSESQKFQKLFAVDRWHEIQGMRFFKFESSYHSELCPT